MAGALALCHSGPRMSPVQCPSLLRLASLEMFRILIALASITLVQSMPHFPKIEDSIEDCLHCLCVMIGDGKCEVPESCKDIGLGCGPYRITRGYWIDAGRPVLPGDDPDTPGALERCVQEPFCAMETVENYMKHPRLQDCDGDKKLTCSDLFLTHIHGPGGCKMPHDTQLMHLNRCLVELRSNKTTTPT